MKLPLFVLLFSLINRSVAQSLYYTGFDLGPKIDFFRLEELSNPYRPNIQLQNDLSATAGFNIGVLMDNRLMLETGIYRSHFRTRFRLIDEGGMIHFNKEPLSTLNAYLVPVLLGMKVHSDIPRWHFFYGFGFNAMVYSNSSIDGTVTSIPSPRNPDDPAEGYLQYTLSGNALAGNLLSILGTIKAYHAINEQLHLALALEGRYGVAGDNVLNINHVSPKGAQVRNVVFTSGNAVQMLFGFRYFMEPYRSGSGKGADGPKDF